MKIAVPTWENRLSPVFDTSSRLLIVDIASDGRERDRSETEFQTQNMGFRCIRIRNLEIDTLICGAITGLFEKMLQAAGIEVISGISGNAEEVIDAYRKGNLMNPKFLMPGYKENKEED